MQENKTSQNTNQQDSQNQNHSAKDGNDFVRILIELSQQRQEKSNEYANANTTATQERTHSNTHRGGIGNASQTDLPKPPQPRTISIPRIRDTSTYNGSGSRILGAESRRGGAINERSETINERSQELANTSAELQAITQEVAGFTLAEANQFLELQDKLQHYKKIHTNLDKQKALQTYIDNQNILSPLANSSQQQKQEDSQIKDNSQHNKKSQSIKHRR
ncbi:hypothetical protein LS74_000335 [Helicobacter magdeburgensis]|uniref:Uncharacterized protein n=1 Tax=Helicobacter magdeburgensis TaxID=471858 RepID=A0A4U8T3A5_9HELI|nr:MULTISPECIES: hypothetical protein [Helicobacter]TLD93834.1 hypothetical protein LS74_000335 [Helicobacter magdeburgensis]BDB66052.1 hypothetical protein Hc94105_0237 [Helicobacter cinaedi]